MSPIYLSQPETGLADLDKVNSAFAGLDRALGPRSILSIEETGV